MTAALTELDGYLSMIEDLRGQVRALVADLPADALNWRPLDPEQANSLAVLAAHVAGAEHYWIAEVLGGLPATRQRETEFVVEAAGPAELVERLDRTAAETRRVLASLAPADLDGSRQARDRTVPARWCLLHVIDHTALHLGHMQITYQLWAGGHGKPSPFWYERLPK